MTPITRSRFRPRYPSSSFAPGLLFLAGEQGAWYDPSDLSTLFQDANGTVPVTAVGQSVRLMRDKSGRGNHATAPSDAARPVLQVDGSGLLHLTFNGSSQSMSTSAVNLTATNKITVFAGIRKLSDVALSVLVENSTNGETNNGSFLLYAPGPTPATRKYTLTSRGTALSVAHVTNAAFTAPVTNVLTGIGDISGDSAILRVNGAQSASSTTDQGVGNYGNYSIFVGSRNNSSARFNGLIYGLIVRGAASSTSEISFAERWMAAKTGITI